MTNENDETVEEQDVEPERVVDPPEATSEDTTDVEQSADQAWVRIDQTAIVTLPSGASYALQTGSVMQLPPDDIDYIVGEGYGTRTDDPNEG